MKELLVQSFIVIQVSLHLGLRYRHLLPVGRHTLWTWVIARKRNIGAEALTFGALSGRCHRRNAVLARWTIEARSALNFDQIRNLRQQPFALFRVTRSV